jgi:hypothetical protein
VNAPLTLLILAVPFALVAAVIAVLIVVIGNATPSRG